jgi:septum site-determining protein MinD
MTRRILVISGKGGVGKTTLVANLAYALAELGQKVVALDANPTTPNLGLHFGFHLAPKTLHNALRGEAEVEEIAYWHPFGFYVIPGSLSLEDIKNAKPEKLSEITSSLLGKADFVLMDCSAGLGKETLSAMEACDEIIFLVNPDLPSVLDALRALKIAEGLNKKSLGVVVNRVKNAKYELKASEIEEILGLPVIAKIPEDRKVEESIALKIPLISFDSSSPASIEIKKLACFLAGKKFEHRKKFSLLGKILRLFK